jgi:E3 ubiquitin-protein ligase TRIP12
VAGFASSILSSRDHSSLVIGALQLVELLLVKRPDEYKPAFRREGVFHEIQTLAARSVAAKAKDKSKEKDKDAEVSSSPPPQESSHSISAALAATIPGYKKLISMSLDPEDAITFRGRVIQFKFLTDDTGAGANDVLELLRRLGTEIASPSASEEELSRALKELAALFRSEDTSVSSFELLQSGAVDGLMTLATSKDANGKPASHTSMFVPHVYLSGPCTSTAGIVRRVQRTFHGCWRSHRVGSPHQETSRGLDAHGVLRGYHRFSRSRRYVACDFAI